MTARISPAQPPFSVNVQQWLDKTLPPGRAPLVLFTTLARDERLFGKFFSGGLLDRGHLTLRQREIVIDRTTALCGSEYEWGVHIAVFAERAGLTPGQIKSLADGKADDGCWSEDERVLLLLCDALHNNATIDQELWQQLLSFYSELAIVELIMVAGFYRTVSYLTNALDLPLEPGSIHFPT